MTSERLGSYRVSAYNTAHDSENKIHDDAVARRFSRRQQKGFSPIPT